MLPLFSLATPANTTIFFGFLMQIASFDLLPMDLIYDIFFPEVPDSVNSNLENEGFGTTLIVYNLGSMIIAILSFPVLVIYLMIIRLILPCCTGKSKLKC